MLRRWRASPLPRWGYFAGRITATVLASLASGAVILAVGAGLGGLRVSAADGPACSGVRLGGLAWARWARPPPPTQKPTLC